MRFGTASQRFQEPGSGSHVGALQQLDEGELRGAVDGYKQVKLASGAAQLDHIKMEKSQSGSCGTFSLPACYLPLQATG